MVSITSTQRDSVGAFVAPLVIYGAFVALSLRWPAVARWELYVKSFTIPALIAGFLFLTRRFGYYAIPLAILYLPAMYVVLLMLGLVIGGGI
jgi:hypothetical protein